MTDNTHIINKNPETRRRIVPISCAVIIITAIVVIAALLVRKSDMANTPGISLNAMTGETFEIHMDRNSGLQITSDGAEFNVSDGNKPILRGLFTYNNTYLYKKETAATDPDTTETKELQISGMPSFYYKTDSEACILIDTGHDAGLLLYTYDDPMNMLDAASRMSINMSGNWMR